MNKEALEKEAEEWVISNTEIYDDKFGIECENEPRAKEAYLASAEPREKRIAELEVQIEKMKCCENCRYCNKWGEANSNSPNCKKCNWASNWKLRR